MWCIEFLESCRHREVANWQEENQQTPKVIERCEIDINFSISFREKSNIVDILPSWALQVDLTNKVYHNLLLLSLPQVSVRLRRKPITGSSMPGNKCLPAPVAAPQAFACVPLPSHVSRMLIRSYGFIMTRRECRGHQPEHEQGPLVECFPRCHFLIPSYVSECRSLGELRYTEIAPHWIQDGALGLNLVDLRQKKAFVEFQI